MKQNQNRNQASFLDSSFSDSVSRLLKHKKKIDHRTSFPYEDLDILQTTGSKTMIATANLQSISRMTKASIKEIYEGKVAKKVH